MTKINKNFKIALLLATMDASNKQNEKILNIKKKIEDKCEEENFKGLVKIKKTKA